MMVVFWVIVIALVVWLVLSFRSDQATGGAEQRHEPEELLAERFARGEIDEDEFARRLEVLGAERHASS
jgi:putative membrane protein